MTSKEMEARSGVARANIRYYEAEGLLRPKRAKNGYRDYSEDDLAALEKIKLLRRLGVTIEELQALSNGGAELSAVLDRRLAELRGERETLGRVERVCGDMKSAGVTFDGLDAEIYLQALDEGPQALPLPVKDALPVVTSAPRRFLAWLLDVYVMASLVLIAGCLAGYSPGRIGGAGFGLLIQLCLLFLEPLAVCLAGTTPGKALLGMRLRRSDGGKLTYGEAFSRYLYMLWSGLGLGIPIWSWVQLYRAFRRCRDGESQPWDSATAYEAAPFQPLRHVGACLLAVALMLAATETANSASQLPPNRGNLTVAEFAENFNHQAAYMDLDFTGQRLNEQGAWEDKPFDGTAYASFSGWDEKNLPFTYTVEEGRVTTVTIYGEVENAESWLDLPVEQAITATTALLWAGEETPFWSFARKGQIEALTEMDWTDGSLALFGGTVTSHVEQEGFCFSGGALAAVPEREENYFSVTITVSLDN